MSYTKEYYQKNKEKLKARSKLYRDTHKEKIKIWRKGYAIRCPEVRARGYRKYNLRKDFGITLEQYNAMLLAQSNKCYLCKRKPSGRKLSVDHNHTTGQVRKLLCQQCNALIGMAHENIKVLQRTIIYLQEDYGSKTIRP